MIEITTPGIYQIPEDEYHADPVPAGSLSQTGAKTLLDAPAKFAYQREHPKTPTSDQELGTAAHLLVLGTGPELVEVKAKDWRTDAAKAAAEEARKTGKVPLLTRDMVTVRAMAAALRAHPVASKLFDPNRGGMNEASAFWQDAEFGIWRRCRFDRMPRPGVARVPAIGDYKTCVSASPASFAKSVGNFGYDMQADWYCAGYRALFGIDPAFVFVAQEKTPPYLVATYQLRDDDLQAAQIANRRACEMFRDCLEAGAWPGYSPEIETLELPRWVEYARREHF